MTGRCTALFGGGGRIALVGSGLVLGVLLAGCSDAAQGPPASAAAGAQPDAQTGAALPGTVSPRSALSPQVADTGDGQSATTLQNDPSAPPGTPLCGFAAQESNALSRQLLSRHYADAGQCSAYACYDAATATYIGADGYRHVCR